MSVVLGGIWVMATLILSVLLMWNTVIVSGFTQSNALRQAAVTYDERQRTAISISQITSSDGGGGTNVDVVVDNTGATTVVEKAKMDVIMKYTDAPGNEHVKRLTYVSGAPSDDEWTFDSITPDVFNPNLWDSGEQATLKLKVVPPVKSGSVGTVLVSTPNGATDSDNFTN